MVLVVRLQIWSGDDEDSAVELAVLEAENVSDLADVSDYQIRVRSIAKGPGGHAIDADFQLTGHYRDQGAWRLVRDALNQLLQDTPEGRELLRWRRNAKFKARPQHQVSRENLIERAFDGFERTFEGLADGSAFHRWQSIHTAPRDGSWILLSGGSLGFGWEGVTQPNCVVGQYAVSEVGGPCWQFAPYDSGYYGEYEAPTHWRPLPEPVPAHSDFGPGGRFCANALASAADLAIIEAAFSPDEERPEFEMPRFWSNPNLCDPDTIIALVLQKPTTNDLARTVVAYGFQRVMSVLERVAQSGELSVERVERAYEWLGPILKGIAAAARELIGDDIADKFARLEGTISRDIDLEFNDELAKPPIASLSHWIRTHQPSGFGGETVLKLIQDGRVDDVLDYLDAIDAGGFA